MAKGDETIAARNKYNKDTGARRTNVITKTASGYTKTKVKTTARGKKVVKTKKISAARAKRVAKRAKNKAGRVAKRAKNKAGRIAKRKK